MHYNCCINYHKGVNTSSVYAESQSWHKSKWSLPGSESNPITHLKVKLDELVKEMMRYCQEQGSGELGGYFPSSNLPLS